jgi:peptidoglycan/LPS O-acetylase OafA/YrhL
MRASPPLRRAPRESGARGPARAYFPGVEGLRAVAALLVLCTHVGFVSGLNTSPGVLGALTARAEVGVGVFFVISGFLLYRPWAAAHLRGEPGPPLGPFLLRRLLRILPLYLLVLATTVALVPSARPQDGWDLLLLPLLGQVYRHQTVYLGIPQAWSLCVELAFYLTLPLWAGFVGRQRLSASRQFRREVWCIVGLLVTGLVSRYVLEVTEPVPRAVWHGFLPVWFDLFALGFLLAVLSVRWSGTAADTRRRIGRWTTATCWSLAALLYFVLATQVGLGRTPLYERTPGQAVAEEVLWGAIAFLLLLPAVLGNPRPLLWRPVALVGLASYGVYLWHQLVVRELLDLSGRELFQVPFLPFLAVVLLVTVALAAVTYSAVERPAVRWGRRLGVRAEVRTDTHSCRNGSAGPRA